MAERGVFAVDRGVFDHPCFAKEAFTEREAWLWMIGAAAWKPMRIRTGRHMAMLERGQLSFSERFLAVRWRWSKSRVHRFLKRLQIEAMVILLADHETNLITICNYDKFAFNGTTRKSKTGPLTEPLADQSRTKEEELKEVKNIKEVPADAAPAAREPTFEIIEPIDEPPKAKLFRKGKTILVSLGLTENRAGNVIGDWLKKKNDPTGILAALEYARDHCAHEPIGYVTRLLNGASNGKPSLSDEARELANQARELERQAGIGR